MATCILMNKIMVIFAQWDKAAADFIGLMNKIMVSFAQRDQVLVNVGLMHKIMMLFAQRHKVIVNVGLMHKIMVGFAQRHKVLVVRFCRKSYRMMNLLGGLITAPVRAPAVMFSLKVAFDFSRDVAGDFALFRLAVRCGLRVAAKGDPGVGS